MTAIIILAHRGTGKGRGENSFNAFVKGLADGAVGIELDIRMTKDNIPVCVHDETLKRVYDEDVCINTLELTDIKDMALLNDDAITTLECVFEKFGDKIFYDVEIKDPAVIGEFAKLVKRFGLDELMVSSFKHPCLSVVKEHLPKSGIAPIIDFKGIEDYKMYIQSILSEYTPYSLNLDTRFFQTENESKRDWFKKVKVEHDVKLAFWTVNTLEDFNLIKDLCDFVITDKPALFKDVIV